MEFLRDFTESIGNIVAVMFFFLCVFGAHLVLSKPVIRDVLKRGGVLLSIVAVLIAGSWIYSTFVFLIFDASFFLRELYQSSFGVSDVFQFIRDLVQIGVYGLGAYLIYRSYAPGTGAPRGRSGLLGMLFVFCLLTLSACSSDYSDPWYQFRDFLGTANMMTYPTLDAVAYLIAGIAIFRLVQLPLVDAPLRKLGTLAHILAFCVATNMLQGVLYHPAYYFYRFVQGIASQENFLPIFAYLICAVLFVVGLVITYRFIDGNPARRSTVPPPASASQEPIQ